MRHQIHLIKVPTTKRDLFPYSHFADEGHDPGLEITHRDYLYLTCSNLFKLKPNVQNIMQGERKLLTHPKTSHII